MPPRVQQPLPCAHAGPALSSMRAHSVGLTRPPKHSNHRNDAERRCLAPCTFVPLLSFSVAGGADGVALRAPALALPHGAFIVPAEAHRGAAVPLPRSLRTCQADQGLRLRLPSEDR